MKAVVVHGANDLRIDQRPDPVAGPGEVVLDVEWGGICGSDLSYWRHGASGTAALKAPLVLGHEVAGRIAHLGAGVQHLEVGQPVTVHPAELVGDGVLPDRLRGRTNLYPRIRYFGSAAFDPHTDGGFSELKLVRASQVRPLPDGVDTLHGALAEPLAVALHAVGRAGPLVGRDVLVNGAGPIGSLVTAAAKHAGARTVTATDISAGSLQIAKAMGADRRPEPGGRRNPARRRRTHLRGHRHPGRPGQRPAGYGPGRNGGPGGKPARYPGGLGAGRPGDQGNHVDRVLPVRRGD